MRSLFMIRAADTVRPIQAERRQRRASRESSVSALSMALKTRSSITESGFPSLAFSLISFLSSFDCLERVKIFIPYIRRDIEKCISVLSSNSVFFTYFRYFCYNEQDGTAMIRFGRTGKLFFLYYSIFFLCLVILFIPLYQINLSMVTRVYRDSSTTLLENGLTNLEGDIIQIEAIAKTIFDSSQFQRLSSLGGEDGIDFNTVRVVDDFKRHFSPMDMIADCGIFYENGIVLTNKRLYFPKDNFYGNYFSQNGISTAEEWIEEMPRGYYQNSFIPLNFFQTREGSYEGISYCVDFSRSNLYRTFFFATLKNNYILSRLATGEVLSTGRIRISDSAGNIIIDNNPMDKEGGISIQQTGERKGITVQVDIPRQVFGDMLKPFRRLALFFVLAYISIGIILSLFFALRSARPVREIMEEAVDFKGTDSDDKDPAKYKNDFKFIQHFISQAKWDYETLETKLEQQEEIQRENLFERLLYGQVFSGEARKSVKSYLPNFPKKFRIAALALPGKDDVNLASHTMRQTMIINLIRSWIPPNGYTHLSGSILAIFLPDEGKAKIIKRLKGLAEELSEKINFSGRIALSETVSDIQETHNAFYQARHLLRLPGSAPEDEILQKKDSDTFSFPIEFLDASRLYELLIHGDEEKAVAYVNNMFYELCKREYTDEDDIQQIFFLYRRSLIQIVYDLELQIEKEETFPAYDSDEDVSSLFAKIAESIRKICAKVNSRHDEQNAEFEQMVIKYVNDNIINPALYSKMVTAHFNINENRLQNIFRRWTGKSFLKYTESRRMTLARELLLKTNKPITQIFRECGYSAENSFYLAFKRHFGMSPTEMRH